MSHRDWLSVATYLFAIHKQSGNSLSEIRKHMNSQANEPKTSI
ncbi:hypothetical protein J2S19_004003 [Metabacillus malikii]|uniref:Uncharacterized protein n=1 Tax=Metabacillus malikii TaxID=1504265 RepID=A0ABT9ZK64_9BACI|nr:hypothetical protein [Metabacillus malikii]